MKVYVAEDILPAVISVPHGWENCNISLHTDDTSAGPLT